MAYGFDLGLFAGNGPSSRPAKSAALHSSARAFAAWRNLNRDRRLALVDQALNVAANDDHCDGCPVAL